MMIAMLFSAGDGGDVNKSDFQIKSFVPLHFFQKSRSATFMYHYKVCKGQKGRK